MLRDHTMDCAEPEPLLDSSFEIYATQQLNTLQISSFAKQHNNKVGSPLSNVWPLIITLSGDHPETLLAPPLCQIPSIDEIWSDF